MLWRSKEDLTSWSRDDHDVKQLKILHRSLLLVWRDSYTKNTTFNRLHLRSPCWRRHLLRRPLDKNPLRQQAEMCDGWMFQHDNDPTCASNCGGSWSFAKQQPWNLQDLREVGQSLWDVQTGDHLQETSYRCIPSTGFSSKCKIVWVFFFRVFGWYSVSLH